MVQIKSSLNSVSAAETISKNGANPKNLILRSILLIMTCFVLLTVFCRCSKDNNNNNNDYPVNQLLIGKWERIEERILGVEITNNTVQYFFDGEAGEICKAKTNGMYLEVSGENMEAKSLWILSGKTLILGLTVYEKIEKFYWEGE